MTATRWWPAALLLAGVCAYPCQAQTPWYPPQAPCYPPAYGCPCPPTIWCAPALCRPLGIAPNACGPGFYCPNEWCQWYGPCYWLRPPFPPEQGITPGQAISGFKPDD